MDMRLLLDPVEKNNAQAAEETETNIHPNRFSVKGFAKTSSSKLYVTGNRKSAFGNPNVHSHIAVGRASSSNSLRVAVHAAVEQCQEQGKVRGITLGRGRGQQQVVIGQQEADARILSLRQETGWEPIR